MERSKRAIFMAAFLILLVVGGIVTAVIISEEKRKAESPIIQESSDSNQKNGPENSANTVTSTQEFATKWSSGSSSSTITTTSTTSTAFTTTTAIILKSTTTRESTTTESTSIQAEPTEVSTCQNPRIRKEWRDLSKTEQLDFLSAVNEVMKKPSLNGNDNRQMDFAKAHIDHKHEIHNSTIFLLWHRHFIYEYEKELQSINPKVSLPYWDWGMDSENPSDSPLFKEDAFGGTGDNTTKCIKNGIFAGIQTQFMEGTIHRHCVTRDITHNGTITKLVPPSLMMGYALLQDFKKFSSAFEGYPHALAHNFISGDMVTNQAPSDPLFFLVHANVDRYFSIWQEEYPTGEFPGQLEQTMPFYDIPLSVSFKSPSSSDYCYSYSSPDTKTNIKRDLGAEMDAKKLNERNISYPSSVPSEFTKMMGGDPESIKILQNQSTQYIDCLNENGFASPAVAYAESKQWIKIEDGSSRFTKGSKLREAIQKCLPILLSA